MGEYEELGKMEPGALYTRLQRIAELEKMLSEKTKPEYGDPEIIEHRNLVDSLMLISFDELMKYHKFLLERTRETTITREQIKKEILESLRLKLRLNCSPGAYSQIEAILESSI